LFFFVFFHNFSVFLAIPLREQVIIKEKLPFPSGTATAQILALLHEKSIVSQSPASPSFDQLGHPSDEPLAQFHPDQWRLLISTFTASILFSVRLCAYAQKSPASITLLSAHSTWAHSLKLENPYI
jgi:uncharacterized oligopeptide transporter (OPT) family protein